MSKVLDISERRQDKKRKQEMRLHRRKIEAVLKMVQCPSCHLKCGMCGDHLEEAGGSCPSSSSRSEFHLCDTCFKEFEVFMKIKRDSSQSNAFWRNDEWFQLWSTWLEYQRAIRKFKGSIEFRRIAEEFEKE